MSEETLRTRKNPVRHDLPVVTDWSGACRRDGDRERLRPERRGSYVSTIARRGCPTVDAVSVRGRVDSAGVPPAI